MLLLYIYFQQNLKSIMHTMKLWLKSGDKSKVFTWNELGDPISEAFTRMVPSESICTYWLAVFS